MDNVTIILPIHTVKQKGFDTMFTSCIESINSQVLQVKNLIIVHSNEEELISYLNDYDFKDLKVNLLLNKGDTGFMSQVNLGIENTKTEWFSIIEVDDEYASIWFKNVNDYVNAYPDVDGFLPLVVDVDSKGVFAGFTNEAVFAANMNTDIGYLSNEVLLNYQNFQSSGIVMKKDSVEKYGGFKSNMKLTFVYEFLLRQTYNGVKIMTIPRIGYKHTNMRDGSIFWDYKHGENQLSQDEVSFWLESAKKEYFFSEDREINFA